MHMRINQGLNQNTQNVFFYLFFFRGGDLCKNFYILFFLNPISILHWSIANYQCYDSFR